MVEPEILGFKVHNTSRKRRMSSAIIVALRYAILSRKQFGQIIGTHSKIICRSTIRAEIPLPATPLARKIYLRR
jgi:hypothetical protein